MKRAEPILKNRRGLTTPDAGHTHSLVLADGARDIKLGQTSVELDDQGRPHSHPFLVNDAGEVEIGMSSGHFHGVASLVKMTDEEADRILEKQTVHARPQAIAPPVKSVPTKTVEELARENLELSERALDAIVKAKSLPGETPEAALARLYGRDDEVNEAVERLREGL